MPNCSSKPSAVRVERRDHDAGVVDQQVDRPVQAGGELAHRGQAGEVQAPHLGLAGHLRRGGLALLDVSHGQHDMGAVARQRARGGPADAAVGARHDHGLAGQVRVELLLEVVMGNNVDYDNNDVNDYFIG